MRRRSPRRSRLLGGGPEEMPAHWNHRLKHNQEKIRTGEISSVAEVVRDLSAYGGDRGLSTGERTLLVKARRILISEVAIVKGVEAAEAEGLVDDALGGDGKAERPRDLPPRLGRRARARRGHRQPDGPAQAVHRPAWQAPPSLHPARLRGLPGGGQDLRRRRPRARKELGSGLASSKYAGCAVPGEARSLSTRSGLRALREDPRTVVLVHDGSRCLVTPRARRAHRRRGGAADVDGVVPAVPVSDTIKVAENGSVSRRSIGRGCGPSRPRRPSGWTFCAGSTPPPTTACAPRPTTPPSSRRPAGVSPSSRARRRTSS